MTGLGLVASSVRPLWATVQAIFGAAVRDRIIAIEPMEGVRLPELVTVEVVPLLVEQVDARLVFADDLGRGLHRGQFSVGVWGPARKAAGLPESTQHYLRHFFASLLIRGGLSVKAVAKLLGHGSPVETLRTYAHMWPDDEDRSRDAVDAVRRRSDVPTMRPGLEA